MLLILTDRVRVCSGRSDITSSMPVIKSELALANFTFELDQLKPSGDLLMILIELLGNHDLGTA